MSGREVHVWRGSLAADSRAEAGLEATLSLAERAGAAALVTAAHRRRFVLGRGLLRMVLARYLGRGPRELRFARGAYGKPRLAIDGGEWLRFNVSHSGDVLLIAVGFGREVGVDVERLRPIEALGLARRFFSPHEARVLEGLGCRARQEAFFGLWVRKEALAKAEGRGVWGRLDGMAEETAAWAVRELPMVRGYKAALAIQRVRPSAASSA